MHKLKRTILLFAGISLALAGCRTNNPDPKVLIVGTWDAVKMVNNQYIDGTKTNSNTSTTFTSDDYMEFKADGTAIFSSSGKKENATYSIDTDGEVLSVIYQGSTSTQLITVWGLTATELVIYQEMPALIMQNKSYKTTIEGSYRKR